MEGHIDLGTDDLEGVPVRGHRISGVMPAWSVRAKLSGRGAVSPAPFRGVALCGNGGSVAPNRSARHAGLQRIGQTSNVWNCWIPGESRLSARPFASEANVRSSAAHWPQKRTVWQTAAI